MPINWLHIIEGCKQQDQKTQEEFYKLSYPVMIRICLRYCYGNEEEAAVLFNQGMLKVFRNIEQYKGEGELMAWVRKIIVNVCIDSLRKKIKFPTTEISNTVSNLVPVIPEVYTKISGSEIMGLIYELPKNTGLVFNLFVMEGYKHEEIGKMLGISTGTSKWHVNEARRLLKQRIETIFKKEFLANAI